jgi:hypothetical protein
MLERAVSSDGGKLLVLFPQFRRLIPVESMKLAIPLIMLMLIAGCSSCGNWPAELNEPAGKFTPLQVSIWPCAPQIQLVPANWDVYGLRMSLFCGANYNVDGLDAGAFNIAMKVCGAQVALVANIAPAATGMQLSLVGNQTYKRLRGVQVAAFGNACTEMGNGFQLALLLNMASQLEGLQLSGVNFSGDLRGAQISPLINDATRLHGFQFGLVNFSEKSSGVQFGLLNFMKDGFLPFFPVINFNFSR